MNTSTKLILVGAIAGTLGVSGLARLVYANQPQPQVVILQHSIAKTTESSDGDGEANDDVKEQQEAAKLQKLAKITPQQAQQVAETAQKAKASSIKLENEDGNLIYSVAIAQQEVKVDAGNGKVLYVENSNIERKAGVRPRSSIQVQTQKGDGDGETNDDG